MAHKTPVSSRKKTCWTLFGTFLKIGLFTFGGGYAMIPLIQREASEKRGWISGDDILEIVAIAESTPGPIAINAATFVGYRVAGVPGAFCATLGVVLPSFVIIALLSLVLQAFSELRAVRYAFFGIRAGVLALILRALWSMYRQCRKSLPAHCIMAGAFLLTALTSVSVLVIIVLCAAAGLILSLLAERRLGT